MKKITKFRPIIKSRHPSHSPLRTKGVLGYFPYRSVIRFGSSTELDDTIANGGKRIEINTVNAIKNSSNKLLMKQCFDKKDVRTAVWTQSQNVDHIIEDLSKNLEEGDALYPIVAKNHYGSKGTGNHLLNSTKELTEFLQKNNPSHYIFEKYYNYNKEYRLHITKEGCFYACRKMLKQDTPDNEKWHRHDSNSVWILEENPNFDKPTSWDIIIEHSVKALNAVGLDIGAVDVRVQNNTLGNGKPRENVDFIIVEINSAPSFGDITLQKYIEELPKILNNKINEQK